jgi:hypothetical protein
MNKKQKTPSRIFVFPFFLSIFWWFAVIFASPFVYIFCLGILCLIFLGS